MRTKRLPKTDAQKDLDQLWRLMIYAAEIKEARVCAHLLTQIHYADQEINKVADAPTSPRRGRPRKPKTEAAQADAGNGSARPDPVG
jgi:hypothetical protein